MLGHCIFPAYPLPPHPWAEIFLISLQFNLAGLYLLAFALDYWGGRPKCRQAGRKTKWSSSFVTDTSFNPLFIVWFCFGANLRIFAFNTRICAILFIHMKSVFGTHFFLLHLSFWKLFFILFIYLFLGKNVLMLHALSVLGSQLVPWLKPFLLLHNIFISNQNDIREEDNSQSRK